MLVLLALTCTPASARQGKFYTVEAFLDTYLATEPGPPDTLWLTSGLRQQAEDVLGHRFAPLRVRYWRQGDKSAWILDEVGKEMPITMGVVVNDGRIENLVVLEYRESRGGEITYPFFTGQFKQRGLAEDSDRLELDGNIDGITGATLSVRAARKIATLALLFHRHLFEHQAFQRQHFLQQHSLQKTSKTASVDNTDISEKTDNETVGDGPGEADSPPLGKNLPAPGKRAPQ